MDTATPVLPRREGREGNRWVNKRPSAEEVAEWFREVPLHDNMDHEDFLGGITLIEETKTGEEVVGFSDDNRPIIVGDVTNVFYNPYPRVEARVHYWNKWRLANPTLIGFLLPVPAAEPGGMTVGFNPLKVTKPDGTVVSAVCCTMQVLILEREDLTWEKYADADGVERPHPAGTVVFQAPPGTKTVPLVDRWGNFDANAVPRAQTGAVGRALALADMLVIPGAGIASAEDVQESVGPRATPGAPAAASTSTPGDIVDPDVDLRHHAARLLRELHEYPEALEDFQAWARQRELGQLSQIGGALLKTVVKKLEKMVDGVRHAAGEVEPAGPDIDLAGS